MSSQTHARTRSFRFAAIGFGIALVVGLLFAAGAQAAQKGLMTDLTWGTSGSDMQRTATAMQDVGAQWVRLDISWHDAEPSPGVYDQPTLAMTDQAVALARQAGAKIILLVAQSPQWETGSTNDLTPPANPVDYANFVHFIAARYAGQISAYEIWNEENTTRFWPSGVNPGQYAKLLEATYPLVKTADPNAQVIFGGLGFNDYSFLESVYAAAPLIGHFYDVMATHPYTTGAAPPEAITTTPAGRIDQHSFPAYREVHNTMLAHGDNKPIWFTEMGWSTTTNGGTMGGVDPQTQADYLTRAYQYIQADSYVQVAVTYNFRNNYWAADANDWDDQLGLMTTDFTPKPAYYAFKAVGTVTTATTATTAPAATNAPSSNATSTPTASTQPATGAQPTSTTTGTGTFSAKSSTATTLTALTLGGTRAHKSSVMARCPATLVGSVRAARSGTVLVEVARRGRQGWHWTQMSYTQLTRGHFSLHLPCASAGSLRVRAVYEGTAAYSPSTSGYVYVTGR